MCECLPKLCIYYPGILVHGKRFHVIRIRDLALRRDLSSTFNVEGLTRMQQYLPRLFLAHGPLRGRCGLVVAVIDGGKMRQSVTISRWLTRDRKLYICSLQTRRHPQTLDVPGD